LAEFQPKPAQLNIGQNLVERFAQNWLVFSRFLSKFGHSRQKSTIFRRILASNLNSAEIGGLEITV
jgi:hypothetical protein